MRNILFIVILFLLYNVEPLYCQNDTLNSPLTVADTLQKDFGLFTNSDILNLSLRFDITKYMKKKSKDEYLNAILTYHISKSDSINKEVRLKPRGIMRYDYCAFPPISLNLKKTEFQKSDLDKIEKLKMVTHCRYGNEEYLLKEYLIYKLYNVLTDYSFRVRLLKVVYINTYKKSKPIETYAFLIEPTEMLTSRTNSTSVTSLKLTMQNILPEMMDRMAIFNYMIGNTDWSVPGLHNCKVLSVADPKNPGLGAIVPYDFDYSGLVDAYYAVPTESLGLKSVLDRRFVGICRSEAEFINDLKEFSDKKEEFYRVINEFPYLTIRAKKKMTDYLDSFYDFDKRNSVVSDLLAGCK